MNMEHPPRILALHPKINKSLVYYAKYTLPLADSAIVKNAKSEEVKMKRIECFRFINSAFPFYIPIAQHGLRTDNLQTGDGRYWGNAIHFLLSNKAHGFPVWKQFQDQVRSLSASDACRPHISAASTNRILKHLIVAPADEMDSGAEFLFDSFIRIQLPFQPVLLFQWLTTALCCIALLDGRVSKFCYIPYPKRFEPLLLRLQKLLKRAYRNLGFLFDYLQHQVESENEIFVGNVKLFSIVMSNVLDDLDVSLAKEPFDALNSIKHESCSQGKPFGELCRLRNDKIPFKERNFLFNLDFWRGLPCNGLKLFGSSDEKLMRKEKRDNRTGLTSSKVKLLFEESFGDGRKKIKLNSLMRDDFFLKIMNKLQDRSNVLTSLVLERGEIGIISGVLFINAINEFANAEMESAFWIANKCKLPVTDLLELSLGSAAKQLHDDDVNSIISKITVESEIRCLETHLQHIKAANLSNEPSKKNPLTEDLNEKYYSFQDRIMAILLNFFDMGFQIKNYKEEKDEKLRDWQVALYLLPCFAASYKHICSIHPPVNKNFKVWYLQFIDRLISAYEEEDGIRKSSWANIKKDVDGNSELKDDSQLLAFFEGVAKTFNERVIELNSSQLGEIIKFCPPWKAFFEVLRSNKDGSAQNDDISSNPSIYWNWLMWDFFSKVDRAI